MASKPAPFPSKDEVLRFVQESPGKVGRREIARAFGIRGNDRAALTELLRALEAEGALDGRRRRRRSDGTLPTVTVLVVEGLDSDGALTARPAGWESPDPPPPITLDPAPRGVREPGVGDRVLARLRPGPDGDYLARPMRVLDSGPRRVVGVFHADGRGGGTIEPADRRMRRDFAVRAEETAGARSGELVVGETREGRRLGLPDARVVERLGDADSPGAISLAAIHGHGLPVDFSDEALAEAEQMAAPGLDARSDLRALPLVTIDGADARDFDDAVWAEADSAPDNPGGWRAVVAIADVAHFVRPGSALDKAARERGNSAYFPDRVVPMLPEALSAGLCSLKPGEDRACLAAHLQIDAEGTVRDWRFERALMRSAARLTYDSVQEAVERGASGREEPVQAAIPALYGVYSALRAARERRGALDLDLPERVVTLTDDGAVAHIGFARRFDSHRLIEELMIAANVAAASALEAKHMPFMYRVHDRPDTAKLETLREFLRSRGLALLRGGAVRPDAFNRFLALLEDPRECRSRQPDDPAGPGEGGLQPPQHRPLRARPRALRPLHLADPPLCRSAGAPRPDRCLRLRAGWVRARGGGGAGARGHAHLLDRAAPRRRRSAMPWIAIAPPTWPIAWARSSTAVSPASRASASSSPSTRPGPRGSCRAAPSAPTSRASMRGARRSMSMAARLRWAIRWSCRCKRPTP